MAVKKAGSEKIDVRLALPSGLDTPDWLPADQVGKAAQHLRENPLAYAVGAGVLVLCILGGVLFRDMAKNKARAELAAYGRALDAESPAERAKLLGEVAAEGGKLEVQALYRQGEAAIAAQDYATAGRVMGTIRDQYPQSPLAVRAAIAQAFLAENAGEYQKALDGYREVVAKWPNDFFSRIQYLNIGRVEEKLGQLAEAKAAYDEQVAKFADSAAAAQATQALDKLKASNPELFPVEAPAEAAPEAAAEPAPEAATEPAPAPETSTEAEPAAAPAPEAANVATPESSPEITSEATPAALPDAPSETAAEPAQAAEMPVETEAAPPAAP